MNRQGGAMLVLGAILLEIGIKLTQLLVSAYPNSYVMLGFFPNILDSLCIISVGFIMVYFSFDFGFGVKKHDWN